MHQKYKNFGGFPPNLPLISILLKPIYLLYIRGNNREISWSSASYSKKMIKISGDHFDGVWKLCWCHFTREGGGSDSTNCQISNLDQNLNYIQQLSLSHIFSKSKHGPVFANSLKFWENLIVWNFLNFGKRLIFNSNKKITNSLKRMKKTKFSSSYSQIHFVIETNILD